MLGKTIEELIRHKNLHAKKLDRDVQILLEYFGFGDDKFPTEEFIGFKYRDKFKKNATQDISETDFQSLPDDKKKNFRANVSLILNKKFKGKVIIEEIPALQEIEEILHQSSYIFYDDLVLTLIDKSLIDEIFCLKGLINLLNCFPLERKYDIYTSDISLATKKDFEEKGDASLIIVNDSVRDNLRNNVRRILKYPSHIGICCLDAVYNENNVFQYSCSEMKKFLRNTGDVWCKVIDNKFWFLVEDRTNPIINSLGKIKRTGSVFDKEILPSVIINKLKGHSDELSQKYRPTSTDEELKEIVSSYLDYSKFITPSDKYYVLNENLPLESLTHIEKDLCSFLQVKKEYRSSEILKYLQKRNSKYLEPYSASTLKKNCFNSPLLYKKPVQDPIKRGEKQTYVFIKSYSSDTNPDVDRYQIFRRKLLDLNGQTDVESVRKMRTEQSTLREWLFGNNSVDKCALCGKEYSVGSLVAAHKKRRMNCSINEKTDPLIVMPMCKFGCDQVYENRWIRIVDGVLQENTSEIVHISESEKEYINVLNGRKIDKRWMEGDPSYFTDL